MNLPAIAAGIGCLAASPLIVLGLGALKAAGDADQAAGRDNAARGGERT